MPTRPQRPHLRYLTGCRDGLVGLCSRAMKYRRFGRTELSMPVISCGGMRYQFKWDDVPPNEIPPDNQANLEATIHRALELGINWENLRAGETEADEVGGFGGGDGQGGQ